MTGEPWAGRPGPAPRYATPRDPRNRTHGPRAARYAAAFGRPFMPWQSLVADTALELDPRDPFRWRYPVVVITVPRQAGKSTLMQAVRTDRAIHRPNSQVWMTAQTGMIATDLWLENVKALRRAHPLEGLFEVRRATGSQAITFGNGSQIRPFPPTETSLHGKTTNLVDVDEAWSFDAVSGASLLEAINPTQIAVPDSQLWIVSTAGTRDSVMLREYVDAGRAAVTNPDARIAYFEWSAPEGADLYDPAVIEGFHPAAGFTQPIADLMAEAGGRDELGKAGRWRRSYCNLWSVTSEAVVSLEEWATLARPGHVPPAGAPIVLAYAAAEDRSGGTILALWPAGAGSVAARVVASRPGLEWIAGEVRELVTRYQPRTIAAPDSGPTRTVTRELRRELVTVESVRGAGLAASTETILRLVDERRIMHDGSEQLRDALAAAVLRPALSGRVWAPERSRGPIDALEALTAGAALALDAAAGAPIQIF